MNIQQTLIQNRVKRRNGSDKYMSYHEKTESRSKKVLNDGNSYSEVVSMLTNSRSKSDRVVEQKKLSLYERITSSRTRTVANNTHSRLADTSSYVKTQRRY